MRRSLVLLATAAALGTVPSAAAKDFGPGDLRVCNATRCVPIVRRAAVALLGPFYYSGPAPSVRRRPADGSPYYELRFRNGYTTGIVATRRLDRFLSYGVHLERFRRGVWYDVSPALAAELRRSTSQLRPLRLTPRAVARSR